MRVENEIRELVPLSGGEMSIKMQNARRCEGKWRASWPQKRGLSVGFVFQGSDRETKGVERTACDHAGNFEIDTLRVANSIGKIRIEPVADRKNRFADQHWRDRTYVPLLSEVRGWSGAVGLGRF